MFGLLDIILDIPNCTVSKDTELLEDLIEDEELDLYDEYDEYYEDEEDDFYD